MADKSPQIEKILGPHVSITLSGTVYSPPLPAGGANFILVQALAQNIRYTLNGLTPTAAIGFRLTSGNDPILIEMFGDVTPQFFRETSGAILEYEWYE